VELRIAIDGPSGAGKGTLARRLAEDLGYRHVDTGAMYRAVAWKAVHDGVSLDDEAAVEAIAAGADLALEPTRVAIDGHDVTRAIRTPELDRAAAQVARLPEVRRRLVARQRALGDGGGVVMEGRDIGTVVLPDAELKIYLDASPEARALRRAHDPAHSGGAVASVDALKTEMAARDESDTTRTVSPLLKAGDAVFIDTSDLDVEQVFERVRALVDRALAARR
jgi:cytidylate kinase